MYSKGRYLKILFFNKEKFILINQNLFLKLSFKYFKIIKVLL